MPTASVSRRLTAALTAALFLTTACSSGEAADSSGEAADSIGEAADQEAPEPTTFGSLPADIDYVALGDSYSAGPLVATMRTDPSNCYRSTQNYPAFLADYLVVSTYTDVTCSRADSTALKGRQGFEEDGTSVPPQLDALSPKTDLVTLGIGGNDFGIFTSLLDFSKGGSPKEQQTLQRNVVRVQGRVAGAVRAISAKAPNAAVYVVGYPHILPDREPCAAIRLAPAQLTAAAQLTQRFTDSLKTGAESAGATFVDLDEASTGHDVCAGEDAWINGPEMRPGIAASFHPMLIGMRGTAAEVFSAITGDDAPAGEGSASVPRGAKVVNK